VNPIRYALFGGIVFLAFAAGLYFSVAYRGGHGAPDIRGLLWPDPPQIGTFELDRADGGTLTEKDFAEHWTLVFFGFANCPDVCPTTMSTLNRVYEQLRTHPHVFEKLQILFVSVDPERDDPELLRSYIGYFNEAFIGATADDERLARFADQFGVLYMKIATPGREGYDMDHSASVLLVDPQLHYVGIFSQPHEADDIATRLAAMVNFLEGAQ